MQWRSTITKPVNESYYLCAIIGNSKPSVLYWNGYFWWFLVPYDSWETLDSNEVLYYMNLDDIAMPDGWTRIREREYNDC